jgi:hypothetical protein
LDDQTTSSPEGSGGRILVVGAARSGTMWAADVLRAAGIPCTHETDYTLMARGPVRVAESSWFAVPFLDDVPDDVTVVHIVRDPLDCVQSLRDRRVFAWSEDAGNIWLTRFNNGRWASEVYPEIRAQRDGLHRAIAYWTVWNEAIERSGRAAVRWRLLDVSVRDVEELSERTGWSGGLDTLPRRRTCSRRSGRAACAR